MKINTPPDAEQTDGDEPIASRNRFEYNFRFDNRRRIWTPPTDFYETGEAYVVQVEAADMHEDDFSITFVKGSLFISGVRTAPVTRRTFHQMEINYGELGVNLRVPGPVVKEEIDAVYHNGMLSITLPKQIEPPE